MGGALVKAARYVVANMAEILTCAFTLLMILTTLANVLARYVFNSPFQWAEELARYSFIWVVFLGAAACTKKKRHIVIDGLVVAMPLRVQRLLAVLVDVVTLLMMAIILYFGCQLVAHGGQTTAELRIPKSVVYSVIPVSAMLALLYSLADLRQDVRALASGGSRP